MKATTRKKNTVKLLKTLEYYFKHKTFPHEEYIFEPEKFKSFTHCVAHTLLQFAQITKVNTDDFLIKNNLAFTQYYDDKEMVDIHNTAILTHLHLRTKTKVRDLTLQDLSKNIKSFLSKKKITDTSILPHFNSSTLKNMEELDKVTLAALHTAQEIGLIKKDRLENKVLCQENNFKYTNKEKPTHKLQSRQKRQTLKYIFKLSKETLKEDISLRNKHTAAKIRLQQNNAKRFLL